ncbi:MAG: subtype I-B CRISPR-associated endonuclease Cas1 [Clostridiales bacterium 43-6]|jgi:CRISPR-associated protein Cas1|uniref:CRISPR-associated endonuclease Cas1 n=1 Tax=bioreactor metagenome TaxID=1076179 RepID=A0A645E071_9ZZZZ|nr:MAG: subtype I-B CRISPR-associated endonuclease Cas1 [Clostridiales bacterium 43-6]
MKKTYYLFNPGTLERKDNTLKFTPFEEDGNGEMLKSGQPRYLPVEDIMEFYVFGSLRANSSLYNFLGQKGIAVHFFDYYENYTGSFMPRDSLLSGRMILAQTSAYQNKKKRIELARKFVEGASFNMTKNLRYYNTRGKDLDGLIEKIEEYTSQLPYLNAVDALMGIEGNVRQIYYKGFDLILNDFSMDGRSKMPPRNEVNALISFGNMMCYSQCLRAIHQTQLNPTISYLHTPGERRYSLSMDISEIFKPILVDRVIFRLLNKRELQEKHFDNKLNRCLLNPTGKKIFVKAFDERLSETIQHRSLKRKVSYKHLVKLECYKLSKHLLGMEEYKPFKMWW